MYAPTISPTIAPTADQAAELSMMAIWIGVGVLVLCIIAITACCSAARSCPDGSIDRS